MGDPVRATQRVIFTMDAAPPDPPAAGTVHSSRTEACTSWAGGDTFSGESSRVDCVACLTALADLLLTEVGDLLALNHDLRNRKD